MKKYAVTIGMGEVSAFYNDIQANSKDEAKQKALELFEKDRRTNLCVIDANAFEKEAPPIKGEKGRFWYFLELNTYLWPRTLADELSSSPSFPCMVRIIDLQNDTHKYSDTYVIPHEKKR